jgi:gluconate 2-dehydrogenase gamma chain
MSDDRSLHDHEGESTSQVDEPFDAGLSQMAGGDDDVPENGHDGLSRRALLARGGVVLGGVAVASAAAPAMAAAKSGSEPVAQEAKATTAKHKAQSWADAPLLPFRFFSGEDVDVIGAMANRIYPKDKLGPGATDLGVVEYIDSQLAGGWGNGERMYRHGPFPVPATTGHGWQYAMTPGDAYRVGLDSLNAYTAAKFHGQTFDELKPAQQDKILTAMSTGTKELAKYFDQITAPDFFSMFYENVKEGIFADPSYGGNRGVEGWKLIRYPGDPMARGDDNFKYVLDYNYYPPGPPRPMRPGV